MTLFANPLQPLIDVAESVMVFFHDDAGFGWGASIIGLTVVVRLLILPLTYRSVRSMQGLQRLQPEIKKIQEKHKGDKQRMNQEMMRFYQENKVNPLGSCLPILLQMPFFFALFYMLREDLRIDICGDAIREAERKVKETPCDTVAPGSADFLFIPDLTNKATGMVLVALIVLYVSTQLASSLVTAISMDKTQRNLMLAMPFIFVIFILNFEAGLIVYWITTNLWTVGQQMLVRKLLPPPPKPGADGEPAAATAGKGGGNGSGKAAPAKPPPPNPRKRKRSRR